MLTSMTELDYLLLNLRAAHERPIRNFPDEIKNLPYYNKES